MKEKTNNMIHNITKEDIPGNTYSEHPEDEKGILEVRIIHGKGIGNLLRTVHSILSKHPEVLRYSLAGPLHGGMGATIVTLRPP